MNLTSNNSNLERVIGRAILDEVFCVNLFTNPQLAVCEGGFNLSETEMEHLIGTVGKIKAQKSLDKIVDELKNHVLPWW